MVSMLQTPGVFPDSVPALLVSHKHKWREVGDSVENPNKRDRATGAPDLGACMKQPSMSAPSVTLRLLGCKETSKDILLEVGKKEKN